MKKTYFLLCLMVFMGISATSFAQTDPGTANLKHRWTFDGGSTTDIVGGVVGELIGTGQMKNDAFVATNAHLSFPASQIGLNTYPELGVEIWCTSVAGANSGWSMLWNFGETNGSGQGVNCTFVSIARGDNQSLATLETTSFNGAWGPEYDDGKLHHVAYTINSEFIRLYIDGVEVGSEALTAGNTLANIVPQNAYLGRGGWTADPNWVGSFHKFSIFNKALTSDEILFLYQEGPEENATMNIGTSNIAMDMNYPAVSFNVVGINLGQDITVTAPDGITVQPATFTGTAEGTEVMVIWDMTTAVDGNINFSSGSVSNDIPVKTADDSGCYSPLYSDVINLVDDPGTNSMSYFSGWGTRTVHNIITDPTNVYCGASTISVGDGVGTGSGSLDVRLEGKIEKNTFYRVRAMVKTMGGSFQMGVWGYDGAAGDINNVIDTKGEWELLDFTFATGDSLRLNNHGMFFNNWACTGTIGYIDNWEMYETVEPILSVNKAFEAFDPEYTTVKATVSGTNLNEDITITAPAGVTASPATLPADSKSAEITFIWDGTTVVNGDATVSSTGQVLTIALKSTGISNNSCYVPTYTDKTNIVPDPFVNDRSKFGGWGGVGMVSIAESDTVYCGSHSGRVFGGGSIDVILTNKLQKNKSYLAKAMVMTVGGYFQMGVWGVDAFDTTDKQDSIDTQGAWMPMTFEFVTGDSLVVAEQGMFFNNYQRTGKRGFIDNWELYEIGGSSVITPMDGYSNVYVEGNRIVAEFELNGASNVELSVYSLQGALVAHESVAGDSGRNRKYLDGNLPSGMYLVKISSEGRQLIRKVIR